MQESGEMYLENILILGKEQKLVRAIDVVERMGYSKPSVSRALSILKSDGCICVDADGAITLTEKGREIAVKIYERHVTISGLLISLGVSEETALADACKLEHDISDESFNAIKAHLELKS